METRKKPSIVLSCGGEPSIIVRGMELLEGSRRVKNYEDRF